MMTDRELLELAAKAAGIDVVYEREYLTFFNRSAEGRPIWNPLEDDGDALRLAVKLGLTIRVFAGCCTVDYFTGYVDESLGDDPHTATRRAIVRAADEIGKGMK